jgi:hypothetical protein
MMIRGQSMTDTTKSHGLKRCAHTREVEIFPSFLIKNMIKKYNPKINIAYNKFLDPIFTAYIQANPKFKTWTPPPLTEVHENIKKYNELWEKYGRKILLSMRKATGLNFSRNEIDIHVVSGNPRPFSRPIVIKSRYTEIEFLNTVTHELIHCLFEDNRRKDTSIKIEYPHSDSVVRFHVVLYALIKHIFADVLNRPDMIKIPSKPDDSIVTIVGYSIAWDIVEKEGYEKILDKYFPNGIRQ